MTKKQSRQKEMAFMSKETDSRGKRMDEIK